MTEIISDLQVKLLQLIADKYENVRVKEIRLECSSLVIKFGRVEEKFKRKTLKLRTFTCEGIFCIQSDGLKIVIDLHHKTEYNTFLFYCSENFPNKTIENAEQLQLSSLQQPKLKNEMLLHHSKNTFRKKLNRIEPKTSTHICLALIKSSPFRNFADYNSDPSSSLALLETPYSDDRNTGSSRKTSDFCKPTTNSLYMNRGNQIKQSSSSIKYNAILCESSIPLQDDFPHRKLVGGILNMGNTCYLSSILQALLANGTFCESLISQFWSNTEDIYKYVPAEESFLIKRSGNRNTAATPSDNRNVSQSLKFWNNGHLPATPTFATPTYHLNTSTGHNTMTNVGPKTKNQDAYKRYCTFSCLRETIDVISQKMNLGISQRQFHSTFSDKTINVANLKKAAGYFSHHFLGNRQQDAHEFLTTLLNLIHEEMTTIILLFFDNLDSLPMRNVLVDRAEESSNSIRGTKRPLSSSFDKDPFRTSSSSSSSSNNGNENGGGPNISRQEAAERLSPMSHHFEFVVNNSFSCVSCGYQRQPKRETYRVFSIDIEYHQDHVSRVRGDCTTCTTSSPAPHTSLNHLQSTDFIHEFPANMRPNLDTISLDEDDDDDRHKKASPLLQLKTLFGRFFNDDIRDCVSECCLNNDGRVCITSEIVCLPTTLVIHLKRFRYKEEANQRYLKINTAVSFPVELNLLDCGDCIKHRDSVQCQSTSSDVWAQRPRDIKTSVVDFESFFPFNGQISSTRGCTSDEGNLLFANLPVNRSPEEKQQPDRQFFAYNLSAVVRHIGQEMMTGHYVCDAISERIGDWKRYNDAVVTDIEQEKVLQEQDTPYILFYTKSNLR